MNTHEPLYLSHSTVYSLYSPSEVVPLLRPSLRGKGLHLGRWRLIRSDMDIEADQESDNLTLQPTEPTRPTRANPSGKRRARIMVTDLLEPGNETPKYEFEMELGLRETGRGR